MEPFPNVAEDKVIVMGCQHNTGTVLDVSFDIAIEKNQKVFIIFNNIIDAKTYVQKILNKRSDIEFVIYNYKKEVLEYIEP